MLEAIKPVTVISFLMGQITPATWDTSIPYQSASPPSLSPPTPA